MDAAVSAKCHLGFTCNFKLRRRTQLLGEAEPIRVGFENDVTRPPAHGDSR